MAIRCHDILRDVERGGTVRPLNSHVYAALELTGLQIVDWEQGVAIVESPTEEGGFMGIISGTLLNHIESHQRITHLHKVETHIVDGEGSESGGLIIAVRNLVTDEVVFTALSSGGERSSSLMLRKARELYLNNHL